MPEPSVHLTVVVVVHVPSLHVVLDVPVDDSADDELPAGPLAASLLELLVSFEVSTTLHATHLLYAVPFSTPTARHIPDGQVASAGDEAGCPPSGADATSEPPHGFNVGSQYEECLPEEVTAIARSYAQPPMHDETAFEPVVFAKRTLILHCSACAYSADTHDPCQITWPTGHEFKTAVTGAGSKGAMLQLPP